MVPSRAALILLIFVQFAYGYKLTEADLESVQSNVNGNGTTPIPVVLWHGMGDTCCLPTSMGSIKRQIERRVPGTFVYSVKVGDSIFDDFIRGFLGNVDADITQICEKVANISELSNGYHAMGFSQGGQFLRALAQRCPNPPMRNLITFGGQHQGVYGVPNCDPSLKVCDLLRQIATSLLYQKEVQDNSVQAEYWHDPLDPQRYNSSNIFMTDINNERTINEEYRTNLKKLWNFVMVQFTEDTEVTPRESEWFGFYDDGQAKTLHTLENSTLYTEDRLGLKEMNEQGRLVKYAIKGNHLQISKEQLDDIIDKYIIGNGTSSITPEQ